MNIKILVAASVLLLALSTGAFAMNSGGSGKGGSMGGHDMSKGEMTGQAMEKGAKMSSGNGGMNHSKHRGEMIHESKSGMYQIAYHLIDNMAQMAKMAKMAKMGKKMDMSAHKNMKPHHLMTYFVGPDGKNTTGGKVGFLVVGPDGAKQKTMAMEMTGGYGSDVDFKANGKYTIKAKGVFGEDTVMDEFTYEVE